MSTRCVLLAIVSACLTLGPGCPGLQDIMFLNESNDGEAIVMPVDWRLMVSLESNPSTGYGWELMEVDDGVLANTNRFYVPGWSSLEGAPGVDNWVFTAVQLGTTTLRLEYRRPWDPVDTPAISVFEVQVTVTAD